MPRIRPGIRMASIGFVLALAVPALQPGLADAAGVRLYTEVQDTSVGGPRTNFITAGQGDNVTYTVSYQVYGASAVNFGITVPIDTSRQSFVSCAPAPCHFDGQNVQFALGEQGIGASGTVSVTTSVLGSATGAIQTRPYATGNQIYILSPQVTVDIAPQTTTPPPPATPTFTLTKQACTVVGSSVGTCASSISANPGDKVFYQITYHNTSGVSAQNVTIVDTLSGQQAAQKCFTTQGTCGGPNNQVTFLLGTVAAGASGTVGVLAQVGSGASGTTLGDQAQITANGVSGAIASATASVTVGTPSTGTTLSTSKCVVDVTRGTNCVSSVSANPGDAVQFQIKVTNTGSNTARNLQITDNLYSNMTYTGCQSASGWNCGSSNNVVTSSGGDLPAGQSMTITINATVGSAAAGSTITNTATASAANAAAASGSATIYVNGTPPSTQTTLSVSKCVVNVTTGTGCVSSVSASPGDNVQYRITVTNTGGNTAHNLQITDTLSSNMTYTGCSCGSGWNYSASNNVVTTSGGDLSPGQQVVITINATVGNVAAGTVITNRATASAANAATATSGTASITVGGYTPPPSMGTTLSVSKCVVDVTRGTNCVSSVSANPGDTVQYRITVTNTGSYTAQNLQITDTLSSNVTYTTCSCGSGWNCWNSNNVVTTSGGNLASGQSMTITINATVGNVAAGTTITNVATASASNAAATNSGTATIVVYGYTPQPPVYTPPTNYPPVYYPPVYTGYTSTSIICGVVTAYAAATASAGSMTINGETYALMPQLVPSGVSVTVGAAFCIEFALNSSGQIASMAVSNNLPGANYVCGTLNQYTTGYYPYQGFAPYNGYNAQASPSNWGAAGAGYPSGYYSYNGPIMIGGYPYYVPSNTVFPYQPQYGNYYCFLLSASASVSGSLSVIPTSAKPAFTGGKTIKQGHVWVD